MYLRRLSIRTRLLAAFTVMGVLVAILGGTSLFTGHLQNSAVNRFTSQVVGGLIQADDVWTSMLASRRLEKELLLSSGNAQRLNDLRVQWDKEQARAAELTPLLKARMVGTSVAPHAEALETSLAQYRSGASQQFDKLSKGGFASAQEAEEALKPSGDHYKRAEDAIVEARSRVQSAIGNVMGRIDSAYSTVVTVTVAIIAISVFLVALLGYALSRTIVRPLEASRKFAQELGRGDLTASLDATGSDEAAQLQKGLIAMRDSLSEVVTQVRLATSNIAVASSEIASGNQDLSSRTELAASNLQETASSMQELAETVRSSADSASQANDLAATASNTASRGGEVVNQMVSTMLDIEAASKRISDIIAVIDGIAFQTNILALNAAVEAARAGEQGRGFAVVAGEVRTLAQRSAEAAKEIKSLIGNSVEKVEAGSRLAREAGVNMQEIVESAKRVSSIIGEITTAATEQSCGIGQVNSAVTQLDSVTQQNAALVEESAAAADSLKQQAAQLAKTVEVFRIPV